MYEKLMKIAVGMIFLTCATCITTNAGLKLKRSAKSVKEAIPARVVHLLNYWPDAAVLSGPNRVSGDENRWITWANKSSIEWIKKVLNPAWLATKEGVLRDKLIMIRNEFDEFDVTHLHWSKNGYNIRVSQTSGIIAIKVTPLESTNMGETAEQKSQFAKELCRQIFNSTGMRDGIRYSINEKGKRVKKPVKVTVKDLSTKICGYSFRPELIRQFPDGIVGVAPTMRDEGTPRTTPDGVAPENREDNPDWDKSRFSWAYWWRHVCWWYDGKSIGFFTLKTEGGSWRANYWDRFGSRWFEGPKRKANNSAE